MKESTVKARTVEVKLLVPYMIITIVLCAFIGLVSGWNLRQTVNDKVSAEASQIVSTLSKENK